MAKGGKNNAWIWVLAILALIVIIFLVYQTGKVQLGPTIAKTSTTQLEIFAQQVVSREFSQTQSFLTSTSSAVAVPESCDSVLAGDASTSSQKCKCLKEMLDSLASTTSQHCEAAKRQCNFYNDCSTLAQGLRLCSPYYPPSDERSCNSLANCAPSCGYHWIPNIPPANGSICIGDIPCPGDLMGWDCNNFKGAYCGNKEWCNYNIGRLQQLIDLYTAQCKKDPNYSPPPTVPPAASCKDGNGAEVQC